MSQPPSAESLIPPAGQLPQYINPQRFERTGALFLRAALECGLEPHHRVLDVGCGAGRFAVAAAQYLDGGSYVGIDVSAASIRLCRRYIGSKLKSFRFQYLDAFNTFYNSEASTPASEISFPVASGSIDFVFSNSLFTHLTAEDAEHYVSEIGRVLRHGGRTLNTMFLLNNESVGLLDGPASRQGATIAFDGGSRVKDATNPENWIALDEPSIFAAHGRAGMVIEGVRYGGWCGRENPRPGFGSKDHVVARRELRHPLRVAAPAALRRAIRRP